MSILKSSRFCDGRSVYNSNQNLAHVDARPESNIGKNWRGYKLLAVWPEGAPSGDVLCDFNGDVFCHPLSTKHQRALSGAACIVLLRPGDVFIFNGGVAHTTLCVSDGLGLTGYETFVSMNSAHIQQMLTTCAELPDEWY